MPPGACRDHLTNILPSGVTSSKKSSAGIRQCFKVMDPLRSGLTGNPTTVQRHQTDYWLRALRSYNAFRPLGDHVASVA